MGKDTHALSSPAQASALEVLAANGVDTVIQRDDGVTPTPVISHAILDYNRGRTTGLADGIVITPSHNPPEDGGFKYNPIEGGPADTDVTRWIEDRANGYLKKGNTDVKRIAAQAALTAATTHQEDLVMPYVRDLRNVVDMDAIRGAGLTLGVDPLGGASLPYWEPINAVYGLNITVVNPALDPTFSFMTVDHDGKIRMDCSSPYAMARLVALKDRYRVAFANDPDADRHGIVTPSAGLMNPNSYLAVAIRYLLTHRPLWQPTSAVGKTVVSSGMIDRVVRGLEPAALRGAGRIQVVFARILRRIVLLRRRGERRRQLPAASTGPSGRPTRTGRSWICSRRRSRRARASRSGRALSCADRRSSGHRTTFGSTRRRRPSRNHACSRWRPRRSPPPASPANRFSPK